jgi:hypothetical protein
LLTGFFFGLKSPKFFCQMLTICQMLILPDADRTSALGFPYQVTFKSLPLQGSFEMLESISA